ncbi:MAG: hypothetical protein JSR37_04430, partial [Verrucomicrobia bacterium]|nr:hypothetical protein [Verrucomicrobiota bacterium]
MNSITETKPVTSEIKTFLPVKGIKFVANFLQHEVRAFSDYFSKRISTTFAAKPAIANVFKKTLFTEPELIAPPEVISEDAQRVAIYKDSLFRTVNRSETKPITAEMIAFLAEDLQEVDAALLTQDSAIIEGQKRAEQLKQIIKSGSDDELAAFSQSLVGKSFSMPFTIRKESLAGVAAFENVVDKVEKTVNNIGMQFEQLKAVDESIEQRINALKEWGRKYFPESWCDAIEKSFMLDARDIFIDNCPVESAGALWDKLVQHGIHDTVEQSIKGALDEKLATIQKTATGELDKVTSMIPLEAQSLLSHAGYDLNHSTGWLEVVKQPDNRFTVTIYAKTSLLDLPGPTPLVFANVPAENLNQELFYRLFSYDAWPQWKKAKGFSWQDFTKGFLDQLQVAPNLPKDEDQPTRNCLQNHPLFLALIATKASTDPENYILRLQRQALIDGWAQKSPGLLPLAKSLYSNAKKCLKGVELRKIEAAYLELAQEPQKTQEAFSIPALPALREVAVEFFGQEMGETIDSVTTTKAPESVGVIDQFVTHIKQFRPSLYHIFRLCSDAVRIAYHPILGTLLGLTAHLALTLIVPGYALLGPALYLVVSKMVAQFGIDILYSILPKEMSQYLVKVSSFVREIRDHIFKRIKFAALKILLHFFIDPKVALKLTNLQQSITKNGEISFDLPGNSVKPLTFTPLRITSVTPLPRVQKNPHLSNDMKEWLKIFTQDVLFAHIATLPIPKRGVPNPFWDTFTDTETLHKLIIASATGVEPTAQKMMSFYTLYAIADYLARRDPNSHLSDAFKSNPTELMKWTSSLAAQVPDAQSYVRLKELADYFEFDLTKRYTEDECIARSEASLFHVNPQKFTLGTAIRDVTLQSSWLASNYSTMTQVFNHKNSIDYCFYKELLKDPEIAKRIDQSKGEFEQVVQLYMDPQTQEHTDGILPQSFRTLRLIDTIAYNAHTVCKDKVSDIRFHLNKIDSLLTIPFHAALNATGHTPLKNEAHTNPAEALCHSINPNASYNKLRSAACVREPGSSSQMATVIAVREDTTQHLFKKALTTQGKINVEMITAHKADMVVRALAFFSQSPELLEEGPFQTFFSHCLLNVGALQTQLKARPSFSTHIASCFLHFFSLPTSYDTHIFLLKLALQLDALHDGIIPDLKKYLKNELETTKDRRYASQLADMLKGSTFLFDSSEEIVRLTKGMVPRGSVGIDRGDEIYYPATSVRSIKATGAIFYERDGKMFELVSSDALSQKFQKRACWKNGSTLLVTEDTYLYKTIQLEELQETAVDLKTAAHGLNLLSWLHPVSQMKAYCLRDKPETLSRLDMPKLDLTFRLENNEMVSVGKFHNYFIKRTQKHPALKDIPQYLLLENPKGEQLVLIPKQSEFALIGTYLAKHFAGLMVPHLITKIASQNETSYYVYTLKDELETNDPAAVANCLITAIVKEDAVACKKWLLKLADLGRIYPFTDALYHQLNLAMVPLLVTSDPEWLSAGLKLAAITRSNALLLAHRSEPFTLAPVFASLPEKNRAIYWTMLQMAFRRYLGQLAEGAKPTLDPQEELMLLQEIGEISAHFIKSQFPVNSKVADKILDPQLMLEQLAMSPEIVHRYQKIKTVLGEKISLREAFNYFVYLSIHAPPLERPKADPGLLATLSDAADTLQDTLNQATGLVSEWLKFKSVNPIDKEFIAKVARVGLTHLAHKKSQDHKQFLELALDITVLKQCPTLQEQLESCPITIRSTFEQDLTKYAASYLCLAAGRGPALRSKEFRKNLLALSGNFSPEIQRLILFLQGIALSNKPIEFSRLEEFWNGP